MSVKATTWVWYESNSQGADRLVLLALADFADESGQCFGSWGTLQRKTKLARSTIARCIKRLEACGELSLIEPAKTINGRNLASTWRLPVKASSESDRSHSDITPGLNVTLPPSDCDTLTQCNVNETSSCSSAAAASQPSLPKRRKAPAAKKAPHPILRPDLEDQDWFSHLATLSQFSHIDIGAEYGRCNVWCRNKAVGPPSRRRFINWLGRVEKPLSAPAPRIAKRNSSDDHYDRLGKLMEAANAQEYAMAGGAA